MYTLPKNFNATAGGKGRKGDQEDGARDPNSSSQHSTVPQKRLFSWDPEKEVSSFSLPPGRSALHKIVDSTNSTAKPQNTTRKPAISELFTTKLHRDTVTKGLSKSMRPTSQDSSVYSVSGRSVSSSDEGSPLSLRLSGNNNAPNLNLLKTVLLDDLNENSNVAEIHREIDDLAAKLTVDAEAVFGGAQTIARGSKSDGDASGAYKPYGVDERLAQSALEDAAQLKTGEDCVAFFLKYGPNCPVRFINLIRKHDINSETGPYRPYDLIVVPPNKIKGDYFTMSARGIVYHSPGEPSEFQTLSEFMRDASAFSVCSSLTFFKSFLPRKTFFNWRANVRFNKYARQRSTIQERLFSWKPAFASAMVEIRTQLSALLRLPLITFPVPPGRNYRLHDFLEAQNASRVESVRVIERTSASLATAIERVILDVTRRVRAEDDIYGDFSGGKTTRKPKLKSMAAEKVEIARKAAALKAAAAEEAVLPSFIRLVDYMFVETLNLAVSNAIESIVVEFEQAEQKKGISAGLFQTMVMFEPGGKTTFDPPLSAYLHMIDCIVEDMIQAVNGTSRILYARPFRQFVQELSPARPEEYLHLSPYAKAIALPSHNLAPGGLGLNSPSVAMLVDYSTTFMNLKYTLVERFKSDFAKAEKYADSLSVVRPVFDYHHSFDWATFSSVEQPPSVLQREIQRLTVWGETIERMSVQHVVKGSGLFVESRTLKETLLMNRTYDLEKLQSLVLHVARTKCEATTETYIRRLKVLETRPTGLERYASHLERLSNIRANEAALFRDTDLVEDLYKLLSTFEVPMSGDDHSLLDTLRENVALYRDAMFKSNLFMEEKQAEMSRQLDVNALRTNDALKNIASSLNEGHFVSLASDPEAMVVELEQVQATISGLAVQVETYAKWQVLMQISTEVPQEFPRVVAATRALNNRLGVWKGLRDWMAYENEVLNKPLKQLSAESILQAVNNGLKSSFMLDKSLQDEVSGSYKAMVTTFKGKVSIIADLANPALKPRHWQQLYQACGVEYDPEREEDRSFSEVMQLKLHTRPDLISDISGNATGEAQLEANLAKIAGVWESTDFHLSPYREGVSYILGNVEDTTTQLEDSMATIQAMLGSRFIAGVRDEVEAWDKKLSLLAETLDEWLICQKQWMYLESIFSAEDLQRQLPAETAKFLSVDRRWKEIMNRTHNRPNVLCAVENNDELLLTFQSSNAILEEVQKSLEDYLETKRAAFPRFYFLSNDELLEILSQTKDPHAVQPHLQKCFDAVKSVTFEKGMVPSQDPQLGMVQTDLICAMRSAEGENVDLSRLVPAMGNVEDWLTAFETEMRSSLRDRLQDVIQSHPPYELAVDRKTWFFTGPAQCILAANLVKWTDNATRAIQRVGELVREKEEYMALKREELALRQEMLAEGGKDVTLLDSDSADADAFGVHPFSPLQDFLDYSIRQLDSMISLIRGNLTPLQRTLLGAMTVLDVHSRDVVSSLIEKEVSSLNDFEWVKNLRYYWDVDKSDCLIRQTNTQFNYGYEYLGNSDRLVITPLTDQCYMTLTGALHLKFGGAPAGPAGTGKTETTKDLAKAMAIQCVVFNCSDGLDYLIMGRFFSGLTQAGAWACFDEFNRIDIEVLSVIAQQILTIQRALVAEASTVFFEGREIPISSRFGVFITMNPGYAGRSELPDNLKALFRPVAMMIPDYRLIAEIILFSQGFANALPLSSKMVNLYKLSSEQLSKQNHYDFGMRAVKSVLVAAGQLKRKEVDVDESVLLIRAMRDSNVPKFLAHDLPLFRGILTDLFPGVHVPVVDYGALSSAIEDQLRFAGLQNVPSLVTKIVQTHETQLVRHGVMIVGESGSGKTTNYRTLAAAVTQLKQNGIVDREGFYEAVHEYVLNPKSISIGELYGETHPATLEWKDGIVAVLFSQAAEDTSRNRKWLIFDGPVDAVWIENMNTVLDDNKMLCLGSGKRIKMSDTMHMMFEVRDLAVASPATVSRCGMVYMEPLHVGHQALIDTWAEGRIADMLPNNISSLRDRINKQVPEILAYLRKNFSGGEAVPSLDSNLVESFLHILEVFLSPANGVFAAGADPHPMTAAEKAKIKYAAELGSGRKKGMDDEEGQEAGDHAEGGSASSNSGAEGNTAAPAGIADAVNTSFAATDFSSANLPDLPGLPSSNADGSDAEMRALEMKLDSKAGKEKDVLPAQTLNRVVDLAYALAIIWSFGANLVDSARPAFNTFVKDLLRDALPAEDTNVDLYSVFLNPRMGNFESWEKRMDPFVYDRAQPYFSILVPSLDTTRYSTLFRLLTGSGRHTLFIGETGVGKSVIIADTLEKMSSGEDSKFAYASLAFSAQTTSKNTQEALEVSLERRRKNLLGPPLGKKTVVFVDDINMPVKEVYGAQPPIELLRQVIDQGGFYDRQRLFWKKVGLQRGDVVFGAACAPPGGGRQEITTRLTRQMHMVYLPPLSNRSMCTIFEAILSGFLMAEAPFLVQFTQEFVKASVEMYSLVQKDLLPTPTKSHYTFNLRDIAKVFQGICMVDGKELPDKISLARLWSHEMHRVFCDRLVSEEDRQWFQSNCVNIMSDHLELSWDVAVFNTLIFGTFTSKEPVKPYIHIKETHTLEPLLLSYQTDMSMVGTHQSLVFFKDAISHIARISRILAQPRGNALLVGVGGSGRQSLTRLAAFIADMNCVSIELRRGYGTADWYEDIKSVTMAAGIRKQPTVFLLTDSQIVKESFLEDISNLLNTGDIPGLYKADEMEAILSGCSNDAKEAGYVPTRNGIYKYFVQQVRENLHIVLTMSPIGPSLRTRCRQFPALVNCCTIDWYDAWPETALTSVARAFLEDKSENKDEESLELKELVTPLCSLMVYIHQSVEKSSVDFYNQLGRHNYTTPTSYLELLRLYSSMLMKQRNIVTTKLQRYENGLAKLHETSVIVRALEVELKELQPVLLKAQEDTKALLARLEVEQKEADVQAEIAMKDEAETAKVAAEVSAIKEDCQKDLEQALPALHAATEALKNLNKRSIQEIKAYANPPAMVGFVMSAVCVLYDMKESWDDAKRLLNRGDFMESLANYDKDNIAPHIIRKLAKYINNEAFEPESLKSVSTAIASMCSFVRAVYIYYEVNLVVKPKKEKLDEAMAELQKAETALAQKRQALADVQQRLLDLKTSVQTSLQKKKDLEMQSEQCVRRLKRAQELMGGLGAERERWKEITQQLKADLLNLTGNMALCAGCVAYLGPFTSQFREKLTKEWVKKAESLKIPVDSAFNFTRLLADPVKLREWGIQGLPADDFSTENGVITSSGSRWPLMIDPQGQANQWIRNLEKNNKLTVVKFSQPDYLRALENSIRFGNPVLIESVEESLDPAIDPVLARAVYKKSGLTMIKLGDAEIPYSDGFKLYMTTKLSNPHYLPEICIRVTLINFTVTQRGLEDQLLVDVVRHEMPQLETRKDALVLSLATDSRALVDIESRILRMLASSSGDILEDEELIRSLSSSKVTSAAITARLKEAEVTSKEINMAREQFRAIATRGSVLYFTTRNMAGIDPMYQFSLHAFSRLFRLRLERSEPSEDIQERVRILLRDLNLSVYTIICRGLFEAHKLLFAFLLAVDVQRAAFEISTHEWNALLLGPGQAEYHREPHAAVRKGLLTHHQWRNLLHLETVDPVFFGIADAVAEALDAGDGSDWVTWLQDENAATTPMPGCWGVVTELDAATQSFQPAVAGESVKPFHRLLLLKALREEKVLFGVREFVRQSLGPEFIESPPLDLNGAFNDSDNITPLVFILSPGTDPVDYLIKVARAKGKSSNLKVISLGQGQGVVAEAAMAQARKNGSWVCLQNCHLAVSWLPRLEANVETNGGLDVGEVHPDFRLWLTSMPSASFPISILQSAIKITVEPPRGIKAQLRQVFLDMPSKDWDGSKQPIPYKRLLYSMAFYHAVVLERRKFGSIGWNIANIDFMASDLKTTIMNLRLYLDENESVPYSTLLSVVGQIVYGGRLTDNWDKRCNESILKMFLTPAVVEQVDYCFSESDLAYTLPAMAEDIKLDAIQKYVESLPIDEPPDIFGLHSNASITLQLNESRKLVSTILESAAQRSTGGSSDTDTALGNISRDILSQVNSPIDMSRPSPLLFSKDISGKPQAKNSLAVFLEQEVVRTNMLIAVITSSLEQLHKALKGQIVMSSDLEVMAHSITINKVPTLWENAAYPSLKPLAFWVKNLVQRIAFLTKWLAEGPQKSYWISGFFFPQGFMTGALQMYARSTQIAIDTLTFKSHVTQYGKPEDVEYPPENGVYIHGLFIVCAKWSMEEMNLVEQDPGKLLAPMPVIWLEPIPTADLITEGCYTCPTYKTSQRAGTLSTTGHSTNFITTIHLPTNIAQDSWIRRGTALLTENEAE